VLGRISNINFAICINRKGGEIKKRKEKKNEFAS
jgi:hypothetical protein